MTNPFFKRITQDAAVPYNAPLRRDIGVMNIMLGSITEDAWDRGSQGMWAVREVSAPRSSGSRRGS
jgi:hypothetical protein